MCTTLDQVTDRPRSTQQRIEWSRPVSEDEAHRRASGRRRYNSDRRVRAEWRQSVVYKIGLDSLFERGWKARAARQLGVHRSTICRDYKTALVRVTVHDWLHSLGPNVRSQLKEWLDEIRRSQCLGARGWRFEKPAYELLRAIEVIGWIDTLVDQDRLAVADLPAKWDEIADMAGALQILVRRT